MSCAYRGYEFGASYPDSVCIDGYLWDADSGYGMWDADSGYGTDDGWAYTSGGELPCPNCRFKDAVSRYAEKLRHESAARRITPRGKNAKWFINEARRRIRAYLIQHGYTITPETPQSVVEQNTGERLGD